MIRKYSIKDLEHLTGIKAHTIRIWEQRYNIIEPSRTDTNIRYYVDSDLKRLLNISVLVNGGLRISKVAKMSSLEIQDAVLDKARYEGSYSTQVNGLKIAMLDFNEDLFETIFNQSMIKFGSDETFRSIIGSFIKEVGVLWQTNAISVAHEHFVSNIIRQKLFSAIDQIPSVSDKEAQRFLLYLPSQELHDLGLLYLHLILKRRGFKVVNLGQSCPLEYLKEVHHKVKFDYLISIFTTNPYDDEMDDYLRNLVAEFPDKRTEFLFAGFQLREYKWSGKDNRVHVFRSMDQLVRSLPVPAEAV